ncbi:hypothetical protein IAD21_03555 [Abditibacteriota bacterium]|nr:hypothetical protein IAD21_03555 [Abditibacteriota bacterium]
MKRHFDLAIVGSGFTGSLLAMIARRLGHSVVLLEKTSHPRFAIGESSTPLANLLLEELAMRYDLPRLLPLCKWGEWQRTYPKIGCGLKRGFSFYHHQFGRAFGDARDRSDQLLVAASPHDEIADTHWYRPDFDHFFVREAQELGVEYLDETALDAPEFHSDGVTLKGKRHGQDIHVHARFLVDATGPRGFLHRALNLEEVVSPTLPPIQALYTHFSGVDRLEGNLDFYGEVPPYPVDDAALHHVFEGGWIWVLRFNNGLTSAGVAANEEVANRLRFQDGAPAWKSLLEQLPTVQQQFERAIPTREFVHAKQLAFRSQTIVGPKFALLPSAAGFVNPLLSMGFPLALLGVSRLARIIDEDWESDRFEANLQGYADYTRNELIAAEELIAALYANMDDFALFKSLTLLYFAAASFSETVRRLDKPELAGGFLLHNNPRFGEQSRACFARARTRLNAQQRQELMAQIQHIVEPFDVAGLTNGERNNWYPVLAEDLFAAKDKVGASRAELELLLKRGGF